MEFEFATANQIIFGKGKLQELLKLLPGMGNHPLLVIGKGGAGPEKVTQILEKLDIPYTSHIVMGEPTINNVLDGLRTAINCGCDYFIGFGGGSILDTGKAIAALFNNPGDPLDYLEVVGKQMPLRKPSATYIAIPTTAGTGSEVTKNAVLSVPEREVKVSLRSNLMLPSLVIVDPELTYTMSPALTAATGMDALTQVLEPFVGKRANPISDLFCREGLMRGARSLQEAVKDGSNIKAREDMCWVSLLGGFALANAGLGAVHGLAGPIGGMFCAAHGAICARLLASVVSMNIFALQKRSPDSPALEKYQQVSILLTGNQNASMEEGIEWLRCLQDDLPIPRLSDYGIGSSDFSTIIDKAKRSTSMQANPIELEDEELLCILAESL